MKQINLFLILILFFSCNKKDNSISINLNYPKINQQPSKDVYFGKTVIDPYRNLENLNDTLVKTWIKNESDFTNNFFKHINGSDRLFEKMLSYDKRKSFTTSYLKVTKNDKYFYLKKNNNEKKSRLYYRKNFNSKEILLYDPKDFKPNSNHKYSINYAKPSGDGSYCVIGLSHDGQEISELIIIDVKNNKVLPQIISHTWPSDSGLSWLPDNSGFLYLYYPVIDHNLKNFLKNMKSVLYKIGDNPEKLNIILSRKKSPELNIKKEDFPSTYVSRNGKYIYAEFGGGPTKYSNLYYAPINDLSKKKIIWKKLYVISDKILHGFFYNESYIYKTSKFSSNYEIRQIPLSNDINLNNSKIIIPAKKEENIGMFSLTKDGLFFTRYKNGVEEKLYYSDFKSEKSIKLPQKSGSVYLSSNGFNQSDLWVTTEGWISDYTRYKYDLKKNIFTKMNLDANAEFPEFKNFVIEEVLVSSHDGKKVPLSIIRKKDMKFNGNNPVLMYGYGAYGHSISPFFYPTFLTWVDEGGVFCVPHVRGGGEKGDDWYQAGKKTTKPNTWKDLIACTEYLIDKKYTNNKKTVIYSASAGGILVGRAITEKPELFGVAIAKVGVFNTVRMEITPNGPNNIKEFGTVKDSVEFNALLEMDSYLHIKKNVNYPATIISTGMNDPRVASWQPGKFAARLQNSTSSNKPILFYVDYNSGHFSGGDSNIAYLKEVSSFLSFALWQTGHPNYTYKD